MIAIDNMNTNDNINVIFSKLALALASDYKQIFVIDPETCHYINYFNMADTGEIRTVTSQDNFFTNASQRFIEYVYPDDREKFLKTFTKENLLEKVSEGKTFSTKCRLVFGEKTIYCYIKAIRSSDGTILIGIQDADEQIRRKQADKEAIATYSEIADSLAKLFEVIYYIDINTGHYIEYSSSEKYTQLGLQQSGDNFFDRLKSDVRQIIHPDDWDMVFKALDKNKLISDLSISGLVSLAYRQLLDGKTQYVNLLAFFPNNNSERIVVAVRNIDDQKRIENISETYRHIAGTLASRYEVIYYINVENNKYIELNAHDRAKLTITKEGDDFFLDTPIEIEKYLHEDDRKRINSEMVKTTLLHNIKEQGSVSLTYRQLINGRPQYVNLLAMRSVDDPTHISIGVVNVDSQMRREKQFADESRKFNELATALAQKYEVIYHVNMLTNEYAEYNASEKYAKLEIGSTGTSFFEDCQKNIEKDIYPDDRPLMHAVLTSEYVLENLRETGKFYVNYRLLLDGRPQYVSMFVVRPKDDSTHTIFAVANIDATRRKELEFEKELGNAMDMANRDSLTGVKNKRAYAQAEMELDEQINDGSAPAFAVVVCDINGLKQVNDKQGHIAGDDYIKSATKIICETFKHSPVFRIGGDEFAVILKGTDFEHRKMLMDKMSDSQSSNRDNGDVTVSYGYSDFVVNTDMRVHDVFERADNAMYSNKRMFKAGYNFSGETNSELERTIKFYELYTQLVSAMTEPEGPDIPKIERLLIEISLMFRLCMGETRIYRNEMEERTGGGETLKCFDTGIEGREVSALRIVTTVRSIGTIKVYMADDVPPLNDDELWKVNLVMRTTLSFVMRNRLRDIFEELAYYDDDGYRNFRSIISFFINNKLDNRVAFHYNLYHFSMINQDIGKENADIVMKNHFNGVENIMGEKGYLCRLGGDNFIGMCDGSVLERLIDYLKEAYILYDDEGSTVKLSTSVGLFRLPKDYVIKSPGDIMGRLMLAARAAQTSSSEHIVYYSDSLVKNREKAKKVQQQFPDALAKQEFKVYYQPKVNVITGELSGAEALCRWFKGDHIIPPGDFIPILEETNDICKLDFYMLEQVCRDIREWLDKGMKVRRVSVNFSRRHMTDSSLIKSIAEIIDRYEIPHSYIEIELTETTTDVGFSDLKRVVSSLRDKDIFTSVDDFGVGYSSLNLICDIPWNVLKIDKSILPAEDNDSGSRSMMFRHVVAMAKQFGLKCIAEGVETKEQLKVLRDNKCDYAQGFLFDRPLPKEEFEKRLITSLYKVKGF